MLLPYIGTLQWLNALEIEFHRKKKCYYSVLELYSSRHAFKIGFHWKQAVLLPYIGTLRW